MLYLVLCGRGKWTRELLGEMIDKQDKKEHNQVIRETTSNPKCNGQRITHIMAICCLPATGTLIFIPFD